MKRASTAAAALGAVALVVACSDGPSEGGGSGTDGDTGELAPVTIAWPAGVEDNWSSTAVKAWADEIEAVSDGMIVFEFHWGQAHAYASRWLVAATQQAYQTARGL